MLRMRLAARMSEPNSGRLRAAARAATPLRRVGEVPGTERQNGRDLVMGMAATLEEVAQALLEEPPTLRTTSSAVRPRVRRGTGATAAARSGADRGSSAGQRQSPRRRSGPSQAVRVRRPGGSHADLKETGQGVESIRQREDRPGRLARRVVRGGPRPVLVVDRLPDWLRVALAPRINPAHDALEIREFLDHERRQVDFRETSGLGDAFLEIRPRQGAGNRGSRATSRSVFWR